MRLPPGFFFLLFLCFFPPVLPHTLLHFTGPPYTLLFNFFRLRAQDIRSELRIRGYRIVLRAVEMYSSLRREWKRKLPKEPAPRNHPAVCFLSVFSLLHSGSTAKPSCSGNGFAGWFGGGLWVKNNARSSVPCLHQLLHPALGWKKKFWARRRSK